MFCSNFNKCPKCEWSHNLTENDHRDQCKYRYGLSKDTIYDGQKQILLTPADIKNNLKNCDTHQIKLNAKNVVWSAEVTHQLSESKNRHGKRVNMLFLRIAFVKGITKKADDSFVNICFNVHLETDENAKTSFINRHVFLESKKWGKGADGVFETELIKVGLLKGHKSDIRISVVPASCNLDDDGKYKILGYPDDGFSEVYRMIGTDFDRDGVSKLIFPRDKAAEEIPKFGKSAVKRKRENLINDSVASSNLIGNITKRVKPVENDSGINLKEATGSKGFVESNISINTVPTKIKLTNTGVKDLNNIRPIAKFSYHGKQQNEKHLKYFEKRYAEIKNSKIAEESSETPEDTKSVESKAFFQTTEEFVSIAEKMIDQIWAEEDAVKAKQFNDEFDSMKLRLNKLEKDERKESSNN